MKKNMNRIKSYSKINGEAGMGLIGLVFSIGLILGLTLIVLNIFPVLNEKAKVDMALDSLSNNPSVASMNLQGIATSIEKHLSVNYVTSLNRKSILKALQVKNTKEGKSISFRYEIQRKVFERWRVIYEYEKVVLIKARAQ